MIGSSRPKEMRVKSRHAAKSQAPASQPAALVRQYLARHRNSAVKNTAW